MCRSTSHTIIWTGRRGHSPIAIRASRCCRSAPTSPRISTCPGRLGRRRRRVIFFPGSTIGNFGPEAATELLRRFAAIGGPDSGLLIGLDLAKDSIVLEPAYNDRQGVTAAFNLNLLSRINRELGADFPQDGFRHHAFYNQALGRIEMHLVCREAVTVTIGDVAIAFEAGETIRTECSYKYSLDQFRRLAATAALRVSDVWTDALNRFSVQYLEAGSH